MSEVKVVILNWNGYAHLRTFLPSVLRDTPEKVGIVVADNGSTDGSAEMLRAEFPRVEVLLLDRNYGYAGGYNRALACIEADYYILLNSDVETSPGWCEPLIAALDADPRLAAVQPKLQPMTGGSISNTPVHAADSSMRSAIRSAGAGYCLPRSGTRGNMILSVPVFGPQEPAWPAAGNCLPASAGSMRSFSLIWRR